MAPQNIDRGRCGTVVDRGGRLVVRLFHTGSDQPIEVHLWEDEAEVRYGTTRERFRLAGSPAPDGWIPDAVSVVERLVA